MALSGTLNSGNYEGRYIQFSWTATQDVTNNKSTISWTLKGAGTGQAGYYQAGAFKVVIDGATVYSTSESSRIRLYNGTEVAKGTKVLNHNSDGSRTFKVSIEAGIYTYAVNCTGNTTFTLDTIPRASTFTVSNASVDMGTAVTFNITRASSAFKHKLTLTWGKTTSNIATDVGTSASWTIPLSLANNLPNSTSSGCTITCITYNGSTEIGRKTLSMTIKVPSSVKPTVDSVTISEAVSGLANKFGAYIQNQSKLKVVIAASGAYSSTIKSYSTKILGKTYSGSTITSGFIGSSGSVSVAVTVTDSRGRTATSTKSVTVTAYSDPTITTFTAERCNSDGTLNDNGSYIKFTYAFNITSLNSKNNRSYSIAYKLKKSMTYTTLTSGTAYSLNTTLIPTTEFSADNAYDFQLTVTDYFKSVSQTADSSTAFTLMDFHNSGTGMAIGKVVESPDLLDVALKTTFHKQVKFMGDSYAFQAQSFDGAKGYNLLAVIKIVDLNVNAGIVFELNKRAASAPMTVYVTFKSSSETTDPELNTITYEGDNYGVFLVKSTTSTWKLYVDDTTGWAIPCVQRWYTTQNQSKRISVTFPDEKIEGTDPSVLGTYYRATPAKVQSILDYVYPVGAIFWGYSHVSPASLFGGTWARIQNTFLWACDPDGAIGTTGGEKTHTLTVAELPSHSHGSVYSGTASGTKNTAWLASGGDKMAYGALYAGGGGAHNNMPPYIQVSVWRRTA